MSVYLYGRTYCAVYGTIGRHGVETADSIRVLDGVLDARRRSAAGGKARRRRENFGGF